MALMDDELDELDEDDGVIDVRHVEGVDKARNLVCPWLEKLLKNPDNEDDLGVTLYHVSSRGKRDKDIWFQRLKLGDDVEEFVDLLVEAASTNCEMIRGRNKYTVRVRGRDGCKSFALESPTLRSDENPLTARDFDDEPDLRGVIAQIMRHKEAEQKLLLQIVHEWRSDAKEEKDELRRELREHRQSEHDRRIREEKIISMEFARDMDLQKLKKNEARKDRALEQVAEIGKRLLEARGFIPPAPPPVLGEKAPLEARIMHFVSGLSSEQFDPSRLNPEQRQMLEGIFMDIAAWQARRNSPSSQNADEAPSDKGEPNKAEPKAP